MQRQQRQYRGEVKRKIKRRKDEHVLSNVVSLRISNQERQELEKITKSCAMSVSEIAREALDYWITARKTHDLDS